MGKIPRLQPISVAVQRVNLERVYSEIIESISCKYDTLNCIIRLKPTAESLIYKVLIKYDILHSPQVWLLDPPLKKYDGKDVHHIYKLDKKGHPKLCVYHPKYDKWNGHILLVNTIVPWVITWLFAYEYWLITGKWAYPEILENKKDIQ